MQHNFLAIGKELAAVEKFASKQHATKLSVRVLEREIQMAGTLRPHIAQFTGNPDLSDLLLQ